MRILCLDIPAPGASLEKYAPHLNAEALHAWGLYKSGFIRDIYFRQDRPGVAIFLECDSVDEAMNVMAEFPLAKAGLLSFECIPLGSFINWENLFADEFKNKFTQQMWFPSCLKPHFASMVRFIMKLQTGLKTWLPTIALSRGRIPLQHMGLVWRC